MSPPNLPPKGGVPSGDTPSALLVEGILDGRVLNESTLQTAVEALSKCGAGEFRLDVTGGRFNILPAETHVPADRFDTAAQSNFLDRLQGVVDAAQQGSIETTLRCKLVFADEVAETLFVINGQQIEPVTRRRPRTAQDAIPMPTDEGDAMLGMRRRELMWLAPVLLIVGVFFAWQSGWIDRVLAARAEEVLIETGAFGQMVDVKLERSWGNYNVTLTRGPTYPTTPEALAALRDNSKTLTAGAACELIGNGGELFVQIANEDGKVLAEARTELRTLLTDEAGKVEVKLPGNRSAHHVSLSLSAGKKGK
ncbi:MAG: hypothetical protein ACI85K_002852 [Hyphomicrobiaceae bacterium]